MTSATIQPIRLQPSRMLITAMAAVFVLLRVAAIAHGRVSASVRRVTTQAITRCAVEDRCGWVTIWVWTGG